MMSSLTTQPLDYARTLQAAQHAVMFYDSPKEKWQLVSAHLRESLDRGQGALYSSYFENIEDVRRTLREHGIDTDLYEKRGNLRILELGDYVGEERFDQAASEIAGAIEQFPASGVIRAFGDSTITASKGYHFELLRYERWLGRSLEWPVAGICAYDSQVIMSLGFQFFRDIMKAHGHALFRGIALKLD